MHFLCILFVAVRDDRTRGGRNKFGPLYKRDREMKRRLAMALLSANAGQSTPPSASVSMPAGDLKFDPTTMFQQQVGLMAGLGFMQGGPGAQHSPQLQGGSGHSRSLAHGAHGDGSIGDGSGGPGCLLEQSAHSDSGSCSSLGGSSAGGGGGNGGFVTSGPPFSQQRSQGHHSPGRGAQHSSLTQLNSPQHLYVSQSLAFPCHCL